MERKKSVLKGLRADGRFRSCIVSAIVAVFILSAFPVVSDVASGAQDDTRIVVGTILKPDGFNPFTMTTGISYTVLWITYDFLYTAGRDMEPVPQLAHSHDVSADGLTWTYYLRDDAYWQDGEQVTAHDVDFTFNMIMRNEKECALLGGYLRNVTSVEAISDYTVEIVTEVPKCTMLSINIPILPEHYWSAVEDAGKINQVGMWDEPYFPNGPIGSGPLRLVQWLKAEGDIKMEKFDDYHDTYDSQGPINVDEVLFKVYTNEAAMVNALLGGSCDVSMSVPPTSWDETIADPVIEGQEINVLNMIDFGFNCASEELRTKLNDKGQPAFPEASTNLETTNLSVRKAIAMAINKTQIVEEAVLGRADMGDSMVPTATPFWHYDVPAEEEFEFNLQAARDLLDAAGYVDLDGDDIRENSSSGAELDFSFFYISQTNADQIAAIQIELWLADIGIRAQAQGVPEGQLYTMWFGLEYDLFIWNWQPDPDPAFILSVLTTEEIPEDSNDVTAWSDVYYSNPVYDQLYRDQLKEVNQTERQEIIFEMQRIAYFDVPYVILYYPHDLIAYRTDKFKDFPDMTTYPGTAPDWMWFYFEIVPIGSEVDLPPSNVDAGEDRTCVVNQTLAFYGEATDEDDPIDELTWNWTFEHSGSESYKEGRSIDYKFEKIGQVNVTLVVTDPGGLTGTDSCVVIVGEEAENSGWLRGYVKTATELPVVGVDVVANSTVEVEVSQVTNDTGYYEMNLVAGSWNVTAEKYGYTNDTGQINMTADAEVWLNFTVIATHGDIKGEVIDLETDEPLSGATVEVTVGDDTLSFNSNDEGYFEFLSIPAGTYTVNAVKTGYETNSTEVTVVAGETASASVYLEPVEDESGGLSVAAIAAIGAILAIIAAAVIMMLLKRGKKGASPSDELPPSPDQEVDAPTEDR
ncbi:MAG: carboxypeptidase regulatory-like domain-containing protein [Methanobacteriota archaeon]|nr:MAG: carboxypeptidase regulatory-like domain-containing protein [Euryarchaeota archaeon]